MGKREIINDIENVVGDGNIQEGRVLVEEYKKNFGNDSKVASIEASINFYEGKLDVAMEVIKEGLKFNLLESDLYSIMGSIYEAREEYNRAYLCYEQALYLCIENDKKQYIIEDINRIENEYNINISKISFIITLNNNLACIKQCINSIRNNIGEGQYEIILVARNSTDKLYKWIQNQEDIKYICNKDAIGIAAMYKLGVEVADKENDLFLIDGTDIIMPNTIFNMRMQLYSQNNIGAIGTISNVELNIDNIRESIEFAKKNNIININCIELNELEYKCILINKKSLNKVEWLDNKIRINNYKMLLCKEAYIHKFENEINKEDIKYMQDNFYEKLNIDELLEAINDSIEKSCDLINLAKKNKYVDFQKEASDLMDILNILNKNFEKDKFKKDIANCTKISKSIIHSLKCILLYEKTRSDKMISKIEFELIPLIQELKVYLFYYGKACKDVEIKNEYFNKLMPELCSNKYIDEYEKNGKYKYDLSIIVVGYNKLEYTKMCINSLLENMPSNINYELILVNNGSSDETKEYFESLAPTKQLDIYVNGGGLFSISRIIEGKLFIMISNDIIIGKNAIYNMLACINSDEKIAYVVPSTPNISNYQDVQEAKYTNFVELNEFFEKNNISNPNRWEERVRLCNPVTVGRSCLFYGKNGVFYNRYYSENNNIAFPDDKISLLLRRRGYKLILAKDAYCYHFGSITIKDDVRKINEKEKINVYDLGRKEFYQFFNVDPWGKGFCYDLELSKRIKKYICNEMDSIDILGIDCGFGSNPLKIKELYKEKNYQGKITLTNITSENSTYLDLKGISDYTYEISRDTIRCDEIANNKYDYIVVEKDMIDDWRKLCNEISDYKKNKGIICIKGIGEDTIDYVKSKFNIIDMFENWVILQ